MYTFVDLFCGLGSFHQAFAERGWKCVLASDIDPSTHAVYQKNHGMTPRGDIYKIKDEDIPEHDILCAGFPCQAFSHAGKHLGFDDARGVLFLEIIRFVRARKPKILALENVPGLLKHDGGRTFETITNAIRAEGYVVHHTLAKASDYGLPQMRRRVLFLCIRDDIPHDPATVLDFTHRENRDVTMRDLLDRNYEKRYAYTIRCGGRRSPIESKQNWDGYVVDGEVHRLTLDEAKRLQGFPDDFHLSESSTTAWKHLGNTIPVIFSKLIAEKIEMLI
tara:strand:+ start:8009 stop:8839 length:831 start_codon:yes stop_codon:yes gene_type:complete